MTAARGRIRIARWQVAGAGLFVVVGRRSSGGLGHPPAAAPFVIPAIVIPVHSSSGLFVIPAQAGIQWMSGARLVPGFRRDDGWLG